MRGKYSLRSSVERTSLRKIHSSVKCDLCPSQVLIELCYKWRKYRHPYISGNVFQSLGSEKEMTNGLIFNSFPFIKVGINLLTYGTTSNEAPLIPLIISFVYHFEVHGHLKYLSISSWLFKVRYYRHCPLMTLFYHVERTKTGHCAPEGSDQQIGICQSPDLWFILNGVTVLKFPIVWNK